MVIILSPAKTLDYESDYKVNYTTQPLFPDKSAQLVTTLKKYSQADLRELMSISDNLAELNYERYQVWSEEINEDNARPALLAFKGDVYQGLEADTFTYEEQAYAQQHLRILSGLYGLLRPLDLMQPYRLEMGTKLKRKNTKDLYEFWGDTLTDSLNELLAEQSEKVLVNLASNEYVKALNKKKIQGRLLEISFRELRDRSYKFISFNAKKARGTMAQYIIKNQIEKAEKIKLFEEDDYAFNEKLSKENEWVFTR